MFTLNFDAGANVSFALTETQVSTLASFPDVAKHVWTIGLKNILQDCHASIVRKDFKTDDEYVAAKRAKAELKLGALMVGDVRVRRGERKEPADPIARESRVLAKAWVKAQDKTNAWYAKMGAALEMPYGTIEDQEELVEVVIDRRAVRGEVVEQATKIVESRRKAKAVSVDLDDLGI